ncbi:MAG: hypothetical protein R3C03_13170 [Pirellulaceae bacterium]
MWKKVHILQHITIAYIFATALPPSVRAQDAPIGSDTLQVRQEALTEQYKALEQKLFTLFEIEKRNDPDRSRLLQKAFELSQSAGTSQQLEVLKDLLGQKKFKQAEDQQEKILQQLTVLLTTLQNEGLDSRMRNEVKRHQQYLQEVERLIRIQQSLYSQTESVRDPSSIAPTQDAAAKRADQLAKAIEQNEGTLNLDPEDEPQESSASSPSDSEEQNPVGRRVAEAEKRMQHASDRLREADRNAAQSEMESAEKELADAQKHLEEILRQMREEETEFILKLLEERFRDLLEEQLKVNERTESIAKLNAGVKPIDFELQCQKIGQAQIKVATSGQKAQDLLREEGSSIVLLQTIDQLLDDMSVVANRIGEQKLDALTLSMQQDIVETLAFLVDSVKQSQEDHETAKRNGRPNDSQPAARPGEQPLVNAIAELKLIRSLQERVLRRHTSLSKQLSNHQLSPSQTAEWHAEILRLRQQEEKLTSATRQIEIRVREGQWAPQR